MDREDVRFEVLFNDAPLTVQEDGYVGKLTPGLARIKARLSPGRRIHGLVVERRISGGRKISPLRVRGSRTLWYVKGVGIERKYIGLPPVREVPMALYPNSLRLVEEKPRGLFEVWEAALISQMGAFFFTVQQNFTLKAYWDGEKVVFPGFESWPPGSEWEAVGEFVLPLLASRLEELEPLVGYEPLPEAKTNGLAPNFGRVLWWNYAQGKGAISTNKGAALVRWWNVAKRGRLAFLTEGEQVRYVALHRPATRHPTHFEWEAAGVRASEE